MGTLSLFLGVHGIKTSMLCTFDCLHSLMIDSVLMLLVFASQIGKLDSFWGTCMILQVESPSFRSVEAEINQGRTCS